MGIDNQEINVLLAKHFLGELTEVEEAELQPWIRDNVEEYISLRFFYAQGNLSPQLFDADLAWQRISGKTKIKKQCLFRMFHKYTFAAVAVIILFLIAIVVL